MSTDNLKQIIEALIFISDRPLDIVVLAEILGKDGASQEVIRRCLQELISEYRGMGRAFTLEEVGEGYQFRTRPEFAPWLKKLVRARPLRLTKAALDVLSIVAYKQPVTRHEIESVRGVDSGGVLEHLLQKKLVAIAGKKQAPGRPIIYKTTKEFLEVFNLKDLKDLPTLREYKDIAELGDLEPAARSLLERMTGPAPPVPQPDLPGTEPPASPAEPPASPTGPAAPAVPPDPSQESPAPPPEAGPDIKKE